MRTGGMPMRDIVLHPNEHRCDSQAFSKLSQSLQDIILYALAPAA
jgi:hypothetical protein